MDKLEEIFALQAQLNDGILAKQNIRGPDGKVLTTAAIKADIAEGRLGPNGLPNTWLRKHLEALNDESLELEEELLWKWWSKDQIDLQNIRVEIIDMMHFLTSLAMTAGLTADDFFRLYTAKHSVNQTRQQAGYSKKTKVDDNSNLV